MFTVFSVKVISATQVERITLTPTAFCGLVANNMSEWKMASFFLLMSLVVAVSYQQESASGSSGELKEINILILLSFKIEGPTSEQPWLTDGPMLQPAVELAVEQINEREDILPGYYLNFTVANSACNVEDHTIVNFVESFFYSDVNFAGIVGPTCSDAVELITPITGEDNVSILNFHIANSPRFTDRSKYKNSFGTAGSAHIIVQEFMYLMRANKWERVAVLYEQTKFVHLTAYDVFVRDHKSIYPQGRIVYSAPVSYHNIPLSPIFDNHVRVVLVLSSSEISQRIACLIKRRYPQLTFPAYQFVFAGSTPAYSEADFILNNQHYMCSLEENIQAVEGFLIVHLTVVTPNSSTELVSGLNYSDYFSLYNERANETANESASIYGNPVYDGVWSFSLALNNSIPKLNERGLDIADYMYGHKETTEIIRDEVLMLGFEGASGYIQYSNETGFSPATINLYQIQDGEYVLIGIYTENGHRLTLEPNAKFVESSFRSVELVVHPALASLCLIATIVALVLVIAAHILTLAYRNFHSIRASSYRLGQLAYLGCYIVILCFLCFTISKAAPSTSVDTAALCALQVWTLPLGLTLILGTVTAKTWRLYQIFFLLKKPGMFLKDWVLMVVVLVLTAVDLILCTALTLKFNFTTLRHEMFTDSDTIEVKVECYFEYYYTWLATLILYQGLIMGSAFVLALLTRKIHHKSFKTKSVTLLVYFLAITLALGIPLYVIVNITYHEVNLEYVILSVTFLAVVYICFCFLFFPPLLSLLRVKFFHKLPLLKRFSENVTKKPSCKLSSFS